MRGRPWLASDRTGGPLDAVLDLAREHHRGLVVERLTVLHPGDDDNVYFLGDDDHLDVVQIDTTEGGGPPFLMEGLGNGRRYVTSDPASAATMITAWLRGEPSTA
jgi:hypothetical protein